MCILAIIPEANRAVAQQSASVRCCLRRDITTEPHVSKKGNHHCPTLVWSRAVQRCTETASVASERGLQPSRYVEIGGQVRIICVTARSRLRSSSQGTHHQVPAMFGHPTPCAPRRQHGIWSLSTPGGKRPSSNATSRRQARSQVLTSAARMRLRTHTHTSTPRASTDRCSCSHKPA